MHHNKGHPNFEFEDDLHHDFRTTPIHQGNGGVDNGRPINA